MSAFTIGRAAKAADVNVETIRFYERQGLIDQPPKPVAGARRYDRETVTRIHFVRQAQTIGFSLKEIAELLALRTDPEANCADVRARAIEKRDEVDTRLSHLLQIRGALDELIARCPGGGSVEACTILEAMDNRAPALRSKPDKPNHRNEAETTDMKTTQFSIDGMHCDGCAKTIEALLARLPGVRKVEASFDDRRASVLHDPATVTEANIIAAVEKGGFSAKAEST